MRWNVRCWSSDRREERGERRETGETRGEGDSFSSPEKNKEGILMKARGIAAVLAGILILGGSWVAAQSAKGNPKSGQLVYEQHCLRCHGLSLEGNGPDSHFLIVAPANLQSPRSRAKTDWEMLLAISQGVAFSPMHGWRDRLTQAQIEDVLAYIRMMAPFDTVS